MSEIDLIVPTVTGREDSLERCLGSFERLTAAELNQIVIRDAPSCGEAWLKGLERAEAPYVLLACDDQECASETWAGACVELADEGLLPCPRVWSPDGGIESQGGDMKALGHLITRHQKHRTPVEFTTIPFMSREQAEAIGMAAVHYASDYWVSARGRQLGYETVLCHGFDVIHHQSLVARGAGMSQADRDAMDCITVETLLKATKSGRA